MSTLHKAGTLAWVALKLKEAADAADIVQKATDPSTREQAAYDAATKIAET